MKTTNPIYNPNHLKIAFGSLSSSMSFWIQIPLIIIMYELTDSPLKVTFANVLWSLPWSVLGCHQNTMIRRLWFQQDFCH